ncbi:MAG: hypothetical protein ACM3QS_16920 [Bacteroidota bacterium]
MRAAALSLAAIGLVLLIAAWYPGYIEKPLKDGPGPLSVYMDPRLPAPEYHSPLDWWQTHHADVVNRGDLMQSDCLQCHDPATSCNNCHSYVGAKAVVP